MSLSGVITRFALTQANASEGDALRESGVGIKELVIADKGYLGSDLQPEASHDWDAFASAVNASIYQQSKPEITCGTALRATARMCHRPLCGLERIGIYTFVTLD